MSAGRWSLEVGVDLFFFGFFLGQGSRCFILACGSKLLLMLCCFILAGCLMAEFSSVSFQLVPKPKFVLQCEVLYIVCSLPGQHPLMIL